MPEATDYHYVIVARSPAGQVATQTGVLTLEPIATRAGVLDYLLKQLKKKHGTDFSVVSFELKPNRI